MYKDVAKGTDSISIGASSVAKDAARWQCHWTIKKYNNKPDGVTEIDVPDEVVEFDGNVLTTVAINGMLNTLIGNALGFTTFSNANAWIGVGDGAASFGGGATVPTVAASDTDLTSVLSGTKAVSNAVNGTGSVVRLTVTGHGFGSPSTYTPVYIASVGGTTEANGYYTAFIVDANTLELQGTTFVHAYTSGGTAQQGNRLRKAMQATYPTTPSSGSTQFQSQFTGNDANFVWDEFGIFNGNLGSSTMLNHKGQSLGTKASGATWTITATITIS